MDRSAAQALPAEELLFRDGLGDRYLIRDTHGHPLHESLVLRAELSSVPSFEFALNERLWLLEKFDHPAFLLVRNIMRLPGRLPRISLLADYVGGTRLSEVLSSSETSGKTLPTAAVLFIVKTILDALAALHRQTGEVAHGALAPERIVIADGKVRIADYALGSAIEQLRFSSERYWKDLRVAVPVSAGGARFDRRVDVAQVGMIAVALFAGRPLREFEHIGGLGDVLMGLCQEQDGVRSSLALPIRGWLQKALHMDSRRVFVSAAEAVQALDEAMAESGIRPAPAGLDGLAARSARVRSIITVKTASPRPTPAPINTARKPISGANVRAVKRDAWHVHDTDPEVFTARGGTIASTTRSRIGPGFKKLLWLALLGATIAGAFTAGQFVPAPDWLFSRTGLLVVESKPQGAQLLLDGEPQGVTPITLKVTSGRHEVELRGAGKPRAFNVWVASGDRVAQDVEFPPTRARK